MTKIQDICKKACEWGYSYLSSHGYHPINELPEPVKDTPWSYVVRFATSHGFIYLKQTPPLIFIETHIIEVLRQQFNGAVPEIIAQNKALNCFLMKDAGTPLRKILHERFEISLLCKAIDQFTSLQLRTSKHRQQFFDLDVPDWQLERLPDLYLQLIEQKDLLIADGLSDSEINQLKNLGPKVSDLCEKLAAFSINETIVQPDFHDNNILLDEKSQTLTMIDWGEIVISHPFFSLVNCLYQLKKHHGLTELDDRYLKAKDACFENFIAFESKDRLLNAFEIASQLLLIYAALSSYRLLMSCDQSRFTGEFQRHARFSAPLMEFIKINRGNSHG